MHHWGRVENPICGVRFAGFTSDTYQLQRAGWELAFSRDHYDSISLALQHPRARIYALTAPIGWHEFERARGASPYQMELPIEFRVIHMTSNERIEIRGRYDVSWQALDATPMIVEHEIKSINDLIPFRAISPEAPEIVIPQQNVMELLDLALKMQDPKQREIRDRMRREALRARDPGAKIIDFNTEHDTRSDIKAQIITMAG